MSARALAGLALGALALMPLPGPARCALIGSHQLSWTRAVAIGWLDGPACRRCKALLS